MPSSDKPRKAGRLPYNQFVAKARTDKYHNKAKQKSKWHRQKKHIYAEFGVVDKPVLPEDNDDYEDNLLFPSVSKQGGSAQRKHSEDAARQEPQEDVAAAEPEEPTSAPPVAETAEKKKRDKKKEKIPARYQKEHQELERRRREDEAKREKWAQEGLEREKALKAARKRRQEKGALRKQKNGRGQPKMAGLLEGLLQQHKRKMGGGS